MALAGGVIPRGRARPWVWPGGAPRHVGVRLDPDDEDSLGLRRRRIVARDPPGAPAGDGPGLLGEGLGHGLVELPGGCARVLGLALSGADIARPGRLVREIPGHRV